jgi:CRP-like cAMP-binding protein
MIDLLRQHIVARIGNETEQLESVLGHFRLMQVKRNEQILRQGDICKHVYFIASGCLQVYVYDTS